MKINGSSVRQGNIIEYDGKIWRVVKHNVVSPGKGSAFNQIEMRDARTGTKSQLKLRADEQVEQLRADQKDMQYLFREGDMFTLMDQESFEQVQVNRDLIESEIVGITLPQSTVCTIVEADAVVKGQTASSSYKPALLDNGVKVMVPPFVGAGTRIVVNIAERAYMERAKD